MQGKIIISEAALPAHQKTIPPISIGGVACVNICRFCMKAVSNRILSGGQKFMVMNILFKFALDSEGLYGSDEGAIKSAGNELKGKCTKFFTRFICIYLVIILYF